MNTINFGAKDFASCVPFLVKAALSKEKSKDAQKEVEIALLALSNIEMLAVWN